MRFPTCCCIGLFAALVSAQSPWAAQDWFVKQQGKRYERRDMTGKPEYLPCDGPDLVTASGE